jgi:hypothetical protein
MKQHILEIIKMKTFVVHAEEITKKSVVVEAENITDAYLKATKMPQGLFSNDGFKTFHVLASDIREVVV